MSPEEIREGLLKRRILTINDEISEKSVHEVRGKMIQLMMNSTDPVHFVFDSKGGEVLPALHMYDDMQLFDGRVPMIGVVVGHCSSSATFILLGCSRRLALPHSRFLLHHLEATFKYNPEDLDVVEQFEKSLEYTKKQTDQIVALYCERCGCSKETARQWLGDGSHFGHPLNAHEAKEIGLVTEVVKSDESIADLVGLAQAIKEAP